MRQDADMMEHSARIRKIAKIWSTVSIAFVLFVAIGEFIFPHTETEGPIPLFEWMLVVLFPVIPIIGLAMARRWELWGSLLALTSGVAFFVVISIDRARFMPFLIVMILALVFPAILYLMCWNIERKEMQLAG